MIHTCFYVYKYQLTSVQLEIAVDIIESNFEMNCKDRGMAFTWMMKLFTMWMEYLLPLELLDRFTVVDPLWVQLHKQTTKGQGILKKVAERDFIFIPIVVGCCGQRCDRKFLSWPVQ